MDKFRGNEITTKDGVSHYLNGSLTVDNWKTMPCGRCGKTFDKNGHDSCLGELIGLMNACCGHGNDEEAYIQFLDGNCVRGKDAIKIQEILKKYSNENFDAES